MPYYMYTLARKCLTSHIEKCTARCIKITSDIGPAEADFAFSKKIVYHENAAANLDPATAKRIRATVFDHRTVTFEAPSDFSIDKTNFSFGSEGISAALVLGPF